MESSNHTSDHDLLIELRTEMRGIKDALDRLSNDTAKRVDAIEKKISEDITKRMDSLENWRSYIVGGLAVVTILLAVCSWVYVSQQSIQDSRIDNLIKQVNKIP